MTRRRPSPPSATRTSPQPLGLPSRDDILRFIESSQGSVGKREIARAFNVKGGDRIALKDLLAEMTDAGLLSGNKKGLTPPGKLPPVAVYDVVARDGDGDLVAEPAEWKQEGARPRVLVASGDKKHRGGELSAIGVGDRILARNGTY